MMDYPGIAEKELFYTYIIRYHHYSGNLRLESSFVEFFGQERNINSVLFPKQIGECLKNLGMEIGNYLHNHSVLPFYRLFLKEDLYQKIVRQMTHGKNAYTKHLSTQQQHGVHLKSDQIFYCPVCLKEDTRYQTIKRFHQIEGVYVCPKHKCYLNNISIRSHKNLLKIKEWDMNIRACVPESILIQVARDVEYIIDHPPAMDNVLFRECLFDEAVYRGVFECQGWYEDRSSDWKSYYDNLPAEYAEFREKANFQRFAADKISGGIDPIEYLVFVQSLYGSFEKFIRIYG